MAIAEEEPYVGKTDARSGQWVEITMKKVHRLLSMTDGDERKHVLDYTYVDLHYVEDQRKNLVNKFNLLPGNIVKALGGRGKRKEKISSKEEPLPPLPKLIGVEPASTSNSLISLADLTPNMADLKLNTYKAEASVEHLLLTLMEEIKILKEHTEVPSITLYQYHKLGVPSLPTEYLKRSVWNLDSGCSRHMTRVKRYLHRYSKESGPKGIQHKKTRNGKKYHVTFSEDDEAISQSNTKGDAINFNENRSFPDDEFLEPRSKFTQCSSNIEYFPYIHASETILENNITPTDSPIIQDSVSPKEPPELSITDDHLTLNEHDHPGSGDNLALDEIQHNVINEQISEVQSSTTTISPLAELFLQPPVSQDRWSREKHSELVNIIGEPLVGIITRSKIRDLEAALAHECLYINFFSEMEPKKPLKL
ncbi:hypothetical protein Tco_1161652 [Tanacetum coccineum]